MIRRLLKLLNCSENMKTMSKKTENIVIVKKRLLGRKRQSVINKLSEDVAVTFSHVKPNI